MIESLILQRLIPVIKKTVQETLSIELKKLNLTPPEKEPDIYYSRAYAAKYLGVSQRSISSYVKAGKIKGYRLNGLLRFKKSDLSKAVVEIKTIKYGRNNEQPK